MSKCTVCGKDRSSYVLNNKTVCLRCDEILFDVEIECEEVEAVKQAEKQLDKASLMRKPVPVAVKK